MVLKNEMKCYNILAVENFKFILFSFIVLIIVAFLGYWAFFTIEPGDVHVAKQKQEELEQRNEELEKEVEELKDEIASLQPAPGQVPEETTEESVKPSTSFLKYQKLIDDLQKLIDDKVFMKEKSRGTRVGTVQTFLNIYFNTIKRVDNDFGKTTKADLISFQKAVGLTADGEAGPTTFTKMIEWLEK